MRKAKQKSIRSSLGPGTPLVTASTATNSTRLVSSSSILTWTCALAVLLVTWIVFQRALEGEWLRWDDDRLLLDREEWRGFGPSRLGWMFTTFHMGPYQPLTWLSYAIDHAIFGLDPRAYHRTNVLLHALSAAGLFLVAREIFAVAILGRSTRAAIRSGTRPVALEASRFPFRLEVAAALTALFWSVHPLRVESVAWITERRDCLSGVFFLLALLAWLAHARSGTRRGRWYWVASIAFAASLLSKGLGMVFPLVLVALDYWPLERVLPHADSAHAPGWLARLRALVVEKWTFWALGLLAALVAVVGQRVAGAMVETELHGPSARITQSFYGLAFYVRKTIWPDDLMVMYPMRVPLDAGEARFVASTVGVTLVALLLVIARRRAPAAVVAFACYAVLVAPVLGLVQTGSQLVADRYSYISTLPLAVLAGGAVLHGWMRLTARKQTSSRTALFTAGAALAAAAVFTPLVRATGRQIPVWHDTLSLWKHDIALDPTDNPGRRNLIAAYEFEGRRAADPAQRRAHFERGIEVCRQGMESSPDAACASAAAKLYDLLAAEDQEQRARYLQSALEHALKSVSLVERTLQRLPEAYESAGVILSELGRPAEAVPYLEKLVSMDPASASRRGMLAEILMQAGRAQDALPHLQAALSSSPDSVILLLDLGDAYRLLGQKAQAIEAYERVLRLKRGAQGNAANPDEESSAAARAIAELRRGP